MRESSGDAFGKRKKPKPPVRTLRSLLPNYLPLHLPPRPCLKSPKQNQDYRS
jgi:hypothetical protein